MSDRSSKTNIYLLFMDFSTTELAKTELIAQAKKKKYLIRNSNHNPNQNSKLGSETILPFPTLSISLQLHKHRSTKINYVLSICRALFNK